MSTVAKKDSTYYAKALLTILIMCLGFIVPENSVIPRYGMEVIFLFLGLLLGWAIWDLVCPSIAGMVILSFTQYGSVEDIVVKGLGDSTILMLIFFYIFTQWLNEVGFTRNIMNWFMARRSFIGKPWMFITAFLFMAYVLGFLVSQFPAILLMWPCVYQICESAGYEKRSKFAGFMIFSVSFLTAAGNTSKPWSGYSLIGMKTFMTATGSNLPYSAFIPYCFVVFIAMLIVWILMAKWIFKIDTAPLKKFDYTACISCGYEFNKTQKIAAVLLCILIVCLLVPDFLPECLIKSIFSSHLGIVGTILCILIPMLTIKVDGEKIANFKHLAGKGIDWTVLILLAASIVTGEALKDENAGVMSVVESTAKHYLSNAPELLFYAAIVVVMGILTQFFHNVVLLTSITPVLCSVGSALGLSSALISMLCLIILSISLATPGASTRAGQLFGNGEWIKVSDCYLYGWTSLVMAIVVLLAVGIPMGNILLP